MVDIFFREPGEIPLPPEDVRIKSLNAVFQPKGRMFKILLELDPFQKPPNVDLSIVDDDGNELTSVSIIEAIQPKIELMMHVRNQLSGNKCTLTASLFYSNLMDSIGDIENPDYFERKVMDTASLPILIPLE